MDGNDINNLEKMNVLTTGLLASNITDVTLANNSIETSLLATGAGLAGSNILPASFFYPGRSVRVTLSGIYSAVNNTVADIKILLNSTVLATISGQINTTFTNGLFTMSFVLTCRSAGVSGTVVGQGNTLAVTSSNNTTTPFTRSLLMLAPVTINTTIAQTLDLKYKWTTASASNSIKVTNFLIEKL